MRLSSQIKVLNSCVTPILAYRVQIWSLIKAQAKGLQFAQKWMERRILGMKRKDNENKENDRDQIRI